MKILLLGSQHGNELPGEKLYAYIKKHHTDLLLYVTYKIGNPEAHQKGIRFIESDMNRSYGDSLDTHEARQAKHVQQFIKDKAFDLVLDLHTTVCSQPPCFIIHELNDTITPFIRASHIERVVRLGDPIVTTSLIGNNPRAVAIEVANTQLKPRLFEALCKDIQHYIKGDAEPVTKKLYEVPSLLLKSEVSDELISSLVNFEKTKDGYIPILVGENSYRKATHYLGFKATTETIITL